MSNIQRNSTSTLNSASSDNTLFSSSNIVLRSKSLMVHCQDALENAQNTILNIEFVETNSNDRTYIECFAAYYPLLIDLIFLYRFSSFRYIVD